MERLRRKEGENCKMDDNILPLNALEKEKRLGAINNSKALLAEAEGFEPPWAFTPKMFSRHPRYDRFDMPPKVIKLSQIGFEPTRILFENSQKMREINEKIARKLREMLLAKCRGTPQKLNKIKGYRKISTIKTRSFQDRLVMTASICLRVLNFSLAYYSTGKSDCQ